ncbi:MAG: glycoside hydrolase family 104 protein [Boseongicola sp. SB0677_bin_26]|nr:glycoside hydrolase family 104 protein [Boseongicola sp. SB0665_bin_10]MYG26199.1 glycoside hydrolase family 104 protein [Boseongicola sp. SB0677_bin_26]
MTPSLRLARAFRSVLFWILLAANPAAAQSGTTTDLLALVRALEAPRGYDDYERRIRLAPPKPLTAMTLDEVLSWQSRVRDSGAPSTASGGYQIIRPTLARLVRQHGLDRDALFDPAMQDRLARLLVAECGDPGPPSRHPVVADCLAGIWAALPLATGARRGQSAYRDVAGNRALTDPDTVLAVLAGQPVRLPDRPTERGAPSPDDEAVLAFGTVRLRRIQSAVRAATGTGTLTPSVRNWSFDPYAVD